MLKRYEVDRDGLALKKRQLILKKDEMSHQLDKYDLEIQSIEEQIVEDEKCIEWVKEQIKQGKIRPND